jgi:hypothetical protein
MMARRLVEALGLVALVAACTPAPTSSPSTVEPSAPAAPADGIPTGCQPIDLRSPTGERILLTGVWEGTGVLAWEGETAWLHQIGDCVYGSAIGGEFFGEPGSEGTLTNLSGRVGSDFRIDFEIVIVSQPEIFAFGVYSTMEMLIEWEADGRMRLREDRTRGETAGRCVQMRFECPDPVIWYRVDDSPPL